MRLTSKFVVVAVAMCPILCSVATDIACSTTAGDFTIRLEEEWSPMGVKRFLQLVDISFFDEQLLYRVIPGFLVQFGVAAEPKVMKKWAEKRIRDEPKKQKFKHGTVSFAGGGEDSRSCHIFIAFRPNGERLGNAPHETPIGEVVSGLDALDKIQQNYIQSGYKDLTFLQSLISNEGNIAAKAFPKLDRIKTCRRVETHKQDSYKEL